MGRYVLRGDFLKSGEVKSGGYLAHDDHQPNIKDGYQERLVKYIPAEVIGLYVTLTAILKGSKSDLANSYELINWLVFIVSLVVLYLILRKTENSGDTSQRVAIMLAFVVWVFALGGPFEMLAWYKSTFGALLLPIYSVSLPYFLK